MPAEYEPVHWSVGDDEPAYRGKMVREYGLISSVQTGLRQHVASRKETKSYKKWVDRRDGLGLPPWVREEDGDRTLLEGSTETLGNPLRSSKTLRQWADEYCESPKYLKEFTYEKVSHDHVSGGLRAHILSETLRVEFPTNRECSTIYDRSYTLQRLPQGQLCAPWPIRVYPAR